MAPYAKTLGATGNALRRNVERLRLARGLTQEGLARALTTAGCPMLPGAVGKIERGARRVDVDDLVALAGALRVGVDTLLVVEPCGTCQGAPPGGFTCSACGAQSPTGVKP